MAHSRKESALMEENIYIKRRMTTLKQYQINFTRRLSFTKKRLESVLVESEQNLGLYREYLTKNIPLQLTSTSGRIIYI